MPHVDELVHDQHDLVLVVSLASGDLATTDRDHAIAQSLISSCNDCARLHDDILAIARATKALPPVQRSRDFRLTDADAARLRPAGWRRILGGLANGPLLSRQLGAGLATLGIAGLLLTALPSIQLGGFASSAGASPAASMAAAAEAPRYESLESQNDAAQVVPPPVASHDVDTMAGGEASQASNPYSANSVPGASPAAGGVTRAGATTLPLPVARNPSETENVAPAPTAAFAPAPAATDQASSDGPSTVAIISAVLLVAGLLLLARRFARGATSP
ncbi:MAG TPA: hypothetical protein VFV72_08855 [Candidatus Limnocylindrales bacterium]|nr:hypothetical protein [Candidatus Limnocylindrales bacterium]